MVDTVNKRGFKLNYQMATSKFIKINSHFKLQTKEAINSGGFYSEFYGVLLYFFQFLFCLKIL